MFIPWFPFLLLGVGKACVVVAWCIYQSMTLCLRTVGPAVWSPEVARSGARRSGDETSAGAIAALREHPFLSICCYDDIIMVVLLPLPEDKRRKFFTLA